MKIGLQRIGMHRIALQRIGMIGIGPKLAATLLAAILSACTMPPQPPPASTLDVPAGWRTRVGPSAPIEAAWWTGFGDPALNALVDRALAGNGDLRVARSRMQEYQARLRIAQAARYPALDLSVSPSRARSLSALGVDRELSVYQAGVQAAYEVDVWGRIGRLTEAAFADAEARQAAADAAALSVAASAASGYLTLRGQDAQLALAQATLETRQRSLDFARRQFETGYSSRLEWLQAQSEYRATAETIPQLQRAIQQQENALSILVGANPGPIPRGPALGDIRLPPLPDGLPSELLRRRPDIFQAERAVIAADASLRAARDQLLPSLRLTATAGVQGFTLEQLLNNPFTLWSIGGSVLAPLFEGGRLRAQTEVSAAVRDQAVFAYESTVRNAFSETNNGLVAVERLREQEVQVAERRAAAAEALRIAVNRQRNGYASYLEALDAQRTLNTAEVSLLQIRTNLLTAEVDLYRAMGGGWTEPAR
jgi:NodT family efflux transporter outer membrane factor (OMF) lipoprotein